MLAYRHAFHAGNHADVLKHTVLLSVLRHMAEKAKPFSFIDTHAGAGGYSLEGDYAQKKAEYETGIGRLWGVISAPLLLRDFVERVREFNSGTALSQYPGSPAFAHMALREHDPMRLYELHPTDHRILEAYLHDRPHTHVSMTDGFEALKRDLPPPSRRGVVLIDPSYELKTDYGRVVAAVRLALQRFAQCCLLVWYPQVQLVEAAQLPRRLMSAAQGAPKGWLHATLTVAPGGGDGWGMMGSGMFVANPPWTLQAELAAVLPVLVERLGQFDGARFVLEHTAAT